MALSNDLKNTIRSSWARRDEAEELIAAIEAADSAVGPAGPPGAPGTNGSTWYTSAGAPDVLHNNGDFYLNTSNGAIYEQVSGSWGSPIENSTGPAGAPGSPGAPGPAPSGAQNLVLATPDGSAGVSSLRALVPSDVPTLNQNTTGNASTVTTNANLTGPVTSVGNATAIANGAISNVMLANGAVANLSGTNTGDQTNISGTAALDLPLAGGTMSGAIAMGAHQITGVANPSIAQDAATKDYVDTAIAGIPAGSNILMFTSGAIIGAPGLSQQMTVTGLLSTDTIISVTQKTPAAASLPLLGWFGQINDAINGIWLGDPAGTPVLLVAVKR
jgi:hypothetical protein